MMKEFILTEEQVDKIKNWDIYYSFELVDYVYDLWAYGGKYKWKEWDYDLMLQRDVLKFELHTGGLSYNEDIIDALLSNDMFKTMFYHKWQRDGHYYFELCPESLHYFKVSEYCKANRISRQAVHKTKDKFDWIIASKNNRFIRKKK